MKRIDIKKVLSDPVARRRLMTSTLKAIQAREGREMSWARAYEVVTKKEIR